jgi:hypothetical protein
MVGRSMIIRLMVEHVLGHGSREVEVYRSLLITALLGWKGRRGRVADRIASAVVEDLKDLAKAYLAAPGEPKQRPGAITSSRNRPAVLACRGPYLNEGHSSSNLPKCHRALNAQQPPADSLHAFR